MRLHGVAGVTQQRDAADRPARKRGALKDAPDEGFADSVENGTSLGLASSPSSSPSRHR
jgi:hypothetical protein